ncbi:alpha/beta hydrolase [Planktothrix sp. FACHB-1355]|uniref:Alpha/beta hydrolase n=1 Tax=Aerosakkonema funiforme FACHB-1375 TaxID=2949571 RepID=A0A926VFD4_9CYAN|nr:alpha/beta hydrolase [Planktothrix sp. FACHB-1355]MBD2182839.1 alpha/beta hydrolase [Aerosakkonema funiforme FACHB-1375]MBD3560042.1 alpha/beta hydrolase [Planktothrix sp. FACHB-1355]
MLQIKSHPCFLTPKPLKPDCPLFVFLPGMDGTGQLFRSQTAGLETGFDIRCLAIPANDLTNWDVLADKVVGLIEAEIKQDPQRSVYLCGESFGGCLAIKVALRAPQLFERLILVNPASSISRRPWIYLGISLTKIVPESFYQFGSLVGLSVLAALARIAPEDRQALMEAVQMVPQKTAVWRLSLLKDFDVENIELHRIGQPVLIVAGASDRLLPSVTEAECLAESLPNAEIVVLPESGHACLLEKDVNLYEIMKARKFLPSQSKRSHTLARSKNSKSELVSSPT